MQPHRWLEAQGRLAEPMWLRSRAATTSSRSPGAPPSAIAGDALRALASPDEAVFYTSGRTSNEAAFLYQLFVREYGTNNLPDCSNLCHESSGTGLGEMIGIGKGTVSLADFERADLILVIGQNPGSNHPRMLTTLQQAARRGCRIVSVNPLRERGLVRFGHPQELRGLLGAGHAAGLALRARARGRGHRAAQGRDEGAARARGRARRCARPRLPGRAHARASTSFAKALEACSFAELRGRARASRAREMRELAELYAASERTIACWAMGLTQHRHGVGNVQEVMNLLLLRGNIGQPGAGPCPVRGHSNVQGDRTMGIWERPRAALPGRARARVRLRRAAPARLSHDRGDPRHARGQRAQVFVGLGGNFAVASPDSALVEAGARARSGSPCTSPPSSTARTCSAARRCCCPASAAASATSSARGPQFVTVEDSMAAGAPLRRAGSRPPRPRCAARPRSWRGSRARRSARRAACRGRSWSPTTTASASASRAWCRAART